MVIKEYVLKNVTKSLLSTALFAGLTMSSCAMAEQRIGSVDMAGVYRSLPQAAAIQATLEAEFKDQIDGLKKLEGDFKYQLEKLQRDGATMSEEGKKALQDKIIAMRSDLEAKTKPLQQLQQRRYNEERNKILALINQSVQTVAAKKEYDVVLESNTVLYISPEHDLSKDIIDQVSKIK